MKTKKNQATTSKVEAKAQQSQNGVVGSVVENVNMPMQIIEEKIMLGKTKDAIRFIKELADKGNSNAAYYLAKLYLEGDVVKKNPHKGVEYLQKAADLGHTKALMKIARSGYICAKNEAEHEEVFDWFHKAALKGNAEAEMIISYLYHMGYGCEENKILAGMWHLKARVDDFDDTEVMEILGKHNYMNDKDNDYGK